jgi:hypothetical protein
MPRCSALLPNQVAHAQSASAAFAQMLHGVDAASVRDRRQAWRVCR